MAKTLLHSKATLRSSFLVFFASIIFIGVFYLIWSSVSAAVPTVTFARTGDEIKATVSVSSGYVAKYLSNSNASQYWEYNTVDSADDCNASDFVGSAQALKVADEDSVTFTPDPIPTGDQNYCLKVLYGRSNSQTFQEYYATVIFDTTVPVVTVTQNNLTLRAQTDDASGAQSWAHAKLQASETCDNNIVYGEPDLAGNSQYSLTLTVADNDAWYCFEAIDRQGNTGYSTAFQADTVAPTLTSSNPAPESALLNLAVSQNDDDDTNIVEDNSDINVDSWQYALARTNVDCGALTNWHTLDSLNNASSDKDGAQLTFRTSDRNRVYCFRVADEAGNYGYLRHVVGVINEPPKINRLSQSKNIVTATASDAQYVNRNSWQYAVLESELCQSGVAGNWYSLNSAGFSVNTQNQAVLDLSQTSIDESSHDKWLCFRVSDNIAGNYGYDSIDIDARPPTVNLSQNNQTLSASYETGDGAINSTWSYVKDDKSFDCDADAFVIYAPVKSGYRVSLKKSDVDDYFCFRVADRYANYGFSQSYLVESLDTVAPKLSARQDNRYLILSATSSEGVDNSTWQYADGYSSRPDCEDLAGSRYDDVDRNLRIDLSERDIGDWFCIRAQDSSDNFGYLAIRIRDVDASNPRITVSRDNNLLIAETRDDDIDEDTWQYAVSTVDNAFDCSHDNRHNLLFNTASDQNNRLVLDEDDQDRYFCFRVADESGNYGYERSDKVEAIEAAPAITVVQNTANKRLEVATSDTDVDGTTWGWATFSSNPGDCADVNYTDINHSQITENTRRIYVNSISDNQDGSYYCFRVADTSTTYGTNYGYAKHRYDISAPVILLSLSDNVLTVSASDVGLDATTWRYAKFDSRPDCDLAAVNSALPARNKITLTEADNGSWFCFKVADKEGNVANKIYSVSGIREDQIPQIKLSQTEHFITAISEADGLNANTWRYALSPSEPFCGPGNKLYFQRSTSGALNRVGLDTVSNSYNWICFTVSTKANKAGFAKLQLDRQAPAIILTQNNVVLTAQSSAADLAQDTWAYAKAEENFNCNAGVEFNKLDFASTEISFDLTAADDNDYYCITVSDKAGNDGYEKIRINPVVLQSPMIKISHNNTVISVSATNVDNATWQYHQSTGDMNCSKNGNLSFTSESLVNQRLTLSEADNGSWFCFKVTSLNGRDGYAKILVNNVDSQRPVVSVEQRGNTLIATANESVTWHRVVLSGSNLTCNANAFGASATRGNEVNLTASDNGRKYCFRAVDAAGNAGYGEIVASVDVTRLPDPVTPVDPVVDPVVDPAVPVDPTDPGQVGPGEGDDKSDKKTESDNKPKDDDGESFIEKYRILLIGGGVGLIALIIIAITALLVNQKRQDGEDDNVDYMQ